MISEKEFRILVWLLDNKGGSVSQRILAEELSLSPGKANQLIRDLAEKRLISAGDDGYRILPEGERALQPYKVENAVIMAAGMSTRFAPLSYEKPKGLLVVKGEVLIEREIEQLQAAGIDDIMVVVGYMKEKFFYLEEKYNVKIVVNEDYYRYNNPSTLMRVIDKLSNTYICSSDNYFTENVFRKYEYRGYYAAEYANGETDEYCISYDNKGRINKVTVGGRDAWFMIGHVYFSREFSEKFVEILRAEYAQRQTREQLWEDLYSRYIKQLTLYIKKYEPGVILEFDSLNELREFDDEYINNTDSAIMQNICRTLPCEVKDISDIIAIKSGLTNTSFKFSVKGSSYVYRHPGRGTENYINRSSEAFSMGEARKLELDQTFIYMDKDEGWKISRYIEDARQLDYHNPAEVTQALGMMRKLHEAKIQSPYDFKIWDKTLEFRERLKNTDKVSFEDYEKLFRKVETVYRLTEKDKAEAILCHCDCYSPNFILDQDNKMYLIDWEYSGNDDPASDLGTFICCSDYGFEEALAVIKEYLGYDPAPQELGHYLGYVAIASYYWYLWALYQEFMGKTVGEYLYIWYKNSHKYADEACNMYRNGEEPK